MALELLTHTRGAGDAKVLMGNQGQQGVQVEAPLPCARKSWAPSHSSASHRTEKRICLQSLCHSLSWSLIKRQNLPANLWSVSLFRNVYQIEPLLLVGPCPSPQVPGEASRMVKRSMPWAFTSLCLLLYEAMTELVLHSQCVCVCVCSCLVMSNSWRPFVL